MWTRVLLGMGWLLAAGSIGGTARAQAAPPPALAADAAVEQKVQAWQRVFDQNLASHLRGLASSGDARDLYAAALLWTGIQDDSSASSLRPGLPAQERQAWLHGAVTLRPRDPLVARHEVDSGCGAEAGCKPAQALEFLLREEPDNAEVQLRAFARAQERGDNAAAERAWKSAAAAERYDPRSLELAALLYSELMEVPAPPLEAAVAHTLGRALGLGRDPAAEDLVRQRALALVVTWSGPATGPYRAATRRCAAGPVADDAALLDQCKAVGALMARDRSSLISQLIGLGMMQRLTAGTPQELAWREELRQLRWISLQGPALLERGAVPFDQYAAWFTRDGERAAYERTMEAAGMALTPPAGWQPPEAAHASARS